MLGCEHCEHCGIVIGWRPNGCGSWLLAAADALLIVALKIASAGVGNEPEAYVIGVAVTNGGSSDASISKSACSRWRLITWEKDTYRQNFEKDTANKAILRVKKAYPYHATSPS